MAGNIYGGVVPVVETSQWWKDANITLYKGEFAWELSAAGGSIAEAYLLAGDGQPANSSTAGSYTRLRVSGGNIIVNYNNTDTTLKVAFQSINELLAPLINGTIQVDSISFPKIAQGPGSLVFIDKDGIKTPSITISGAVTAGSADITGNAKMGSATVGGAVTAGSAEITGNAKMGSATVGGAVTAGSAEITGNAEMGSATVGGAVTAGSAEITGNAEMGSATVDGAVTAGSAEITGNAAVGNNLTVTGNAKMGSAEITGTLHFTNAAVAGNVTAGGTVSAGSAEITGNAEMGSATVGGAVTAGSAEITGNAKMGSATVGGAVTAGSAEITGNAKMGSATVGGAVTAGSADITGNAEMGSATVDGAVTAGSAEITGNAEMGSATVGGAVTAGSAEITGNAEMGSATVGGAVTAGSAEITGNAAVGNNLTVTGNAKMGSAEITGTLHFTNAAVAGNVTAGGTVSAGSVNVAGNAAVGNDLTVTGRANIPSIAGNTAVSGTVSAGSAAVAGSVTAGGAVIQTAAVTALTAMSAALQSLETQAAELHGVTLIDELRTALIKNPDGQRTLLQWAAGMLTMGNLLDQLRLLSKQRLTVQDTGGAHEVAYLDDLAGNIYFQFGVYSIGESQNSLPPVNPGRPPALNERAIVKSWNGQPAYVIWNGAGWSFQSLINKPDDYAWEWVIKNYRSFEYQDYSTVFIVYSHDEEWTAIDLPLELYRPYAEQDGIDNNAKAWIRYGTNFIPDWLERGVPAAMTAADTGIDGAGVNPPVKRKPGFIRHKPPLLSDLYGLNVIDGGDETAEAFNQEHWNGHCWGWAVNGGDETFAGCFRYFIDGGNEHHLPFFYNRIYPTLAEAGGI